MPNPAQRSRDARLSVAPMMDWTDRWCRMFHRQLSRRTLLYTEMVTTGAILHGDAERHLGHDPQEGPLALQLGGSDPRDLADAVKIALPFGFDEINLNCGCPSDRVQNGAFGAVLMRSADLVAECTAAMIEVAGERSQITVKCRSGVDDQDPREVLPNFIETVAASGVSSFAVHARKAWLQGLSPKENRAIPPLDYELVRALKRDHPDLEIVLNGGIETLDAAVNHLSDFDGAMIGRAAYHNPANILADADRRIFGEDAHDIDPVFAVRSMYDFIEDELTRGTRLNQITRHMLGAFAGRPGARRWRRVLSERAHMAGAGIAVIEAALAEVVPAQAAE